MNRCLGRIAQILILPHREYRKRILYFDSCYVKNLEYNLKLSLKASSKYHNSFVHLTIDALLSPFSFFILFDRLARQVLLRQSGHYELIVSCLNLIPLRMMFLMLSTVGYFLLRVLLSNHLQQ